jgi:hypothetical protein
LVLFSRRGEKSTEKRHYQIKPQLADKYQFECQSAVSEEITADVLQK